MGTQVHQAGDTVDYEDRRDVSPSDFTDAEHKAVDAMAAPLIRQSIADKGFKGRRNRKAWMRMNRPSKMDAIDRGAAKQLAFLDRVIPAPVEETHEEGEEFLDIPDFLRNQENLAAEKEEAA